ncbi:trafficking protein particle complex subunit 6b-like [Acyrthosiphon pisum]|uniref:ACYPI001799 protein n=1 Tax=Acyrthosiphon pisum TaxID=7029 RepID=C4WU32_ACYPI|nr:trafficking protein particle complex subunit 6b-like [Acyrthosiphon pisum]BAH71402.1 ACYPI001799 [Acyrthosiphon pisum]|eukprot:NP_001156092.1 trafficking protein particle complex subunit 6b-like [Acyrthosiphon pisum]
MSAEDVLFDMLHSEIVSYLVPKSSEDEDLSILEHLGYSCGWRLIERITKELPRYKEELEVLKFICTDFWSCVYKKQVDNLRTNHQGVYVLHDNEFRFFSKLSNGTQYLKSAPKYATFTCGLIRGALENFGISSIVTVEIIRMPSCKFHIQVLPSSS